MIKAKLISTNIEAENIITFWFKPERETRYIAGQFAHIRLSHDPSDARGEKRWFTLSSSPTEELLAITTKFSAKPSSFKKRLQNLKPGDLIEISEPMGDFVLPMKKDRPLVFAAAGIGSTPFRSMVKFLNDKNQDRQIDLLYYEKTHENFAFVDIFRAYGVNFTPIIAENSNTDFYSHLLKIAKNRSDSLIYIAGPEAMVENAYYFLTSQEIAAARLVTDYYHNYKPF